MSTVTTMKEDVKRRVYPEDYGFNLSMYFPEDTGLSVNVRPVHADRDPYARILGPELFVISYNENRGGFAISLSDSPQVVYGTPSITSVELEKVFEWVKINKKALLDHWEGTISSMDLVDLVKKV